MISEKSSNAILLGASLGSTHLSSETLPLESSSESDDASSSPPSVSFFGFFGFAFGFVLGFFGFGPLALYHPSTRMAVHCSMYVSVIDSVEGQCW